jgi:hypothetical protein
MSIGLFVEGKSDKEAISALVRKLLDIPSKIITRTIHRGEMFKPEKVKPYAEALLKQHQDVEKVIVCVDSECTDPEEIWKEVSKAERKLNEVGLPVRYALVIHALEGWLAADSKALGQVLGRQVHIEGNLEEVCKPAELLRGIFAQHGKSFQKTRHDPQIARHADPEEIARHSPSFRRFCQLVKDP